MNRSIAALLSLLFLLCTTAIAGPAQVDATRSVINAKCDATGHYFDASPKAYQLTLTLDDAGEKPVQIKLHFLLSDLKTGKEKRDIEMLHWLESDKYPAFEFVMTSYEGDATSGKIKGMISLHNVSKAIEIPVKLGKSGNQIRITGDFVMNYQDFALPFIRKMLMLTVDPKMKIHIDVLASH